MLSKEARRNQNKPNTFDKILKRLNKQTNKQNKDNKNPSLWWYKILFIFLPRVQIKFDTTSFDEFGENDLAVMRPPKKKFYHTCQHTVLTNKMIFGSGNRLLATKCLYDRYMCCQQSFYVCMSGSLKTANFF